ncbi:MAG: hypothetical protein JWL81_1532 [Verrucomicrobiales bacterium]|nr:hypothetical protein [Verrucomicrobiales bacterium]
MPRSKQWLLPSGVAVAAAAAGWMLMPANPPGQAEGKPSVEVGKEPAPTRSTALDRPVESLSKLRSLPYGAERDRAVLTLLSAADPGQLKAILADPATRLHERSAAVKQWAEKDPTGCFEWYRDLTPARRELVEGYDNLLAVMMRTWAAQDPAAALKAARSVAHRTEFVDAPWEVISAVIASDLTKGLRLACDSATFSSTTSRLTAGLWEKNPGAFVKAAGELRASGTWNYFLDEGRTKALEMWHAQAPAAALATVSALPRDDRARLLPRLMELTFDKDGVDAAAAMVAGQPAGDVKERTARVLLEKWAATDPVAAAKWMDDNVPSNRSEAMVTIIRAAAETQPALALEIAAGLDPGPMRDRAMVGIADAAGGDSEHAAPVLSWLLTQPGDPARRTALGKLTDHWIETAPDQAEAFLKSAKPGEIPDGLASGLAARHFADGAPQALAWAQGLDGTQRDQAVSSVFYRAGIETPPDETVGLLRRVPAAEREAALQAVLYGSLRAKGGGGLAAVLPAEFKTLARQQVESWPAKMEGRDALLQSLR